MVASCPSCYCFVLSEMFAACGPDQNAGATLAPVPVIDAYYFLACILRGVLPPARVRRAANP